MTTTQQETMETTAETLVQRARELAPRLRERAAQTEALRSLPAEMVKELRASGHAIDPLERARYHRDAVYCSALCVRAIDRLFEQSGGSALRDEHPVQRAWRDIHAAAAHHSNRAMQHYGRMFFGLGSANPLFY